MDATQHLTQGLQRIPEAPLKPQQRTYILRVHLIPALFHQLVLADRLTRGTLKQLDLIIRKALKDCIKLPHDTPNSLFDAKVEHGGMGLQELSVIIPITPKNRLESMFSATSGDKDPILGYFANNTDFISKDMKKWGKVNSYGASTNNAQTWRRAAAAALHSSVDGVGLSQHGNVPGIHKWVSDGRPTLSGRNYTGAIRQLLPRN